MKRVLVLILFLFSSAIASVNIDVVDGVVKDLGLEYPVIVVPEDSVNAYTDNIGIYVYQGLIDHVAANYQSVAVILLHEKGHIINYHIFKRQMLIGKLRIEAKTNCIDKMGSVDKVCVDKYELILLKEFRVHEYEADEYAFQLAKSMDYNPELACSIYKLFADESPELDDVRSTHPAAPFRYQRCILVLSNGVSPS